MKENIEEDIEILEELIEWTIYQGVEICGMEKEIPALQNILSDYKRVLKENEDWQKAYQEEKEKQFELLRENQLAKEALKKQCEIADERNQLLKENEELKHKYDRALSDVIAGVDLDNTYIPKQKVKDKIEELIKNNTEDNESVKRFEEMRRNANDSFYMKSYQTSIHKLNAQIETRKHIINNLQELLESEEK